MVDVQKALQIVERGRLGSDDVLVGEDEAAMVAVEIKRCMLPFLHVPHVSNKVIDVHCERHHMRTLFSRSDKGDAGLFDDPVGNILIQQIAPNQVNDLDVPVANDKFPDELVPGLKHLIGLELEADAALALRIENDIVKKPSRMLVPEAAQLSFEIRAVLAFAPVDSEHRRRGFLGEDFMVAERLGVGANQGA